MERILAIQNLSSTPITIDGVLLPLNGIVYPKPSFWRSDDWRVLTTLTTLRVSLTTGVTYDLTTNPNEYANSFARTSNFINDNYLLLIELEKLQAQVITTNATITTITEFSLPNGLTDFQILVKAIQTGTNNYYRGIFYPAVTVVSDVATISPSFGTGAITSRVGLGGGVGASALVSGNILRIQVTGQASKTLLWTLKILRAN